MKLTNEQIKSIFDRYCFIDCCGRVCHAYRHPEHRTVMPVPEYKGFYLVNHEESQLLVSCEHKPTIVRLGDVMHYPQFDLNDCNYIAEFGYGNIDWDTRGYYYHSCQDMQTFLTNPENKNGFYDCEANIPARWGY